MPWTVTNGRRTPAARVIAADRMPCTWTTSGRTSPTNRRSRRAARAAAPTWRIEGGIDGSASVTAQPRAENHSSCARATAPRPPSIVSATTIRPGTPGGRSDPVDRYGCQRRGRAGLAAQDPVGNLVDGDGRRQPEHAPHRPPQDPGVHPQTGVGDVHL